MAKNLSFETPKKHVPTKTQTSVKKNLKHVMNQIKVNTLIGNNYLLQKNNGCIYKPKRSIGKTNPYL